MNKLPLELLLMTFKKLDKKDLKAVRLVSPLWRDLVTELLFDQIYISHRQKDIDVFNDWTANERCSAFVKRLIYDASFLDPRMKLSDYAEHLWEQLEQIDPLRPEVRDYKYCDPKIQELFYYFWGQKKLNKREQKATLAELFESGRFRRDHGHWLHLRKSNRARIRGFDIVKEGFAEYQKQAGMEREHSNRCPQLAIHINRGLDRLPRLRSVTFWEHSHAKWFLREQFDPLNPKPFYLNGPPFTRSWNPLYVLPRYSLHELDYSGKYDRGVATSLGLCRRFETLMSAIACSQAKLSNFDIDGSQFHFEPFDTDLVRDCILSQNVRTALSSLESFHLSVIPSEFLRESQRFVRLQPLLSIATNLVTIDLHGARCRRPENAIPKCVFRRVLPKNAVLQKLRTLRLSKFHVKTKHMAKFIQDHKLDALRLNSIIVRVQGTDPDHMADARAICKAGSSVPEFEMTDVDTLGVIGNPGAKFLILETKAETGAAIVNLAVKNLVGRSGRGRKVVDLSEAWDDVQKYEVGTEPP